MKRSKRKRVLFVGEVITLSHMARPVVLAQAIESDKYEVVLACDPRYNWLLADLSFPHLPLRSLPPDQVFRRMFTGEPLFDAETLDRYVQEDLRLFDRLSPDIVVGDMRHSLAVSCRLASIPYINIVSAHWSPYAKLDFELAEHPLIFLLGEPLAQLVFSFTRPVGSAIHTLPLNFIRLKYGLPLLGFDVKQVYTDADYTVYPDVPELVPTTNRPSTHIYLGPILWSPEVARPEWWDELPPDKPVVYVNLGSSGQPAILKNILAALADSPVSVMAATTARTKIDAAPCNAYLTEFLPGEEAVSRSDLVICNGGAMPAQQALAAGTPFLGIVSNMDQLIFAKAVRRVGACQVLRQGLADVASIRRLVLDMLSQPTYRASAQKLARVYQKTDSGRKFRQLIDAIAANDPN